MIIGKIVILFSMLFVGTTYGQENPILLDFQNALDMAFSGNAGLKATGDAIMVEEYRVKEAISAYYPKLSAYSGFAKTSLESEIEVPNMFGGLPLSIELFPRERYNFGVVSKYDLYAFGRRAARKSVAMKGLERSKIERDEHKSYLYDKTARIFGQTLLARNALRIQKNNIDRVMKKLRLVEDRIDQGSASEYDRIRAKILISKYENRENQARADYNKAKIRLESIIDWDQSYDFMPVGEIAGLKAALPESSFFEPEQTSSFKMMKIGYAILGENQIIQKSFYFPGIEVYAKYDWQNGYQPDIDEIRGDWSVGVSANWVLLDGGIRYSKLKRVKMERVRLNNLITGLRLELISAMESAAVDIERTSEMLSLERERLDLINDGLRIAESRYDQGLLRITDLLDLELDRSEAEVALISAEFGLFQAKLDYKKAIDYYPEIK